MKLWAKILITVLVLALLGGGIFGIVKLADEGKLDSKKVSDLAFSIGGLDGAGNYKNTDESIYTKKAFECQGLECTLDFDAEIWYQIYFYDQNNEFVHTTGKLTGAFVKDSVPFFAKYARIVITPNDDNKVSNLEVLKYAKQLNVKIYREQGFKNYTEDLYETAASSSTMNASGEVTASEITHSCVSTYINVASYNEAMVIGIPAGYNNFYLYFYDASKTFLSRLNVLSDAQAVFTTSEGVVYYSVDFKTVENCNYLRFVNDSTTPVKLFCR